MLLGQLTAIGDETRHIEGIVSPTTFLGSTKLEFRPRKISDRPLDPPRLVTANAGDRRRQDVPRRVKQNLTTSNFTR